jgi:hypothetical protein
MRWQGDWSELKNKIISSDLLVAFERAGHHGLSKLPKRDSNARGSNVNEWVLICELTLIFWPGMDKDAGIFRQYRWMSERTYIRNPWISSIPLMIATRSYGSSFASLKSVSWSRIIWGHIDCFHLEEE